MAEVEKETKTQVFAGTEMGKGRTMYLFDKPGSEKRDKVSAFPPYENLAQLEVGKTYTYEQENVPMTGAGNEGKFYHNFTRKNGSYGKQATGDFNISLAGADDIAAFVIADSVAKSVVRAAPDQRVQQQSPMQERDRYWREKEESDKIQKPIITRLSCISSAALTHQMNLSPKVKSDEAAMIVLRTAKAFEMFATDGNLLKVQDWLAEQAKLREQEQEKLADKE